ncbi:MAG: GNAT family N-acetyltransferase, partial [Myxococcota bacterium]
MTAAETPVHLRDAVPGDGAAIHALVHALATYEREPDAVEATPEGYDQQLAAEVPPFACVLAELPGIGAVGFALTFRTYSTWKGRPGTWLEDFFVVPAARGR